MIVNRLKMTLQRYLFCLALVLVTCMPACGGGVEERTYQIRPQPASIDKVIQLLKRYRDGVPPGSELSNMQGLILDLRNQAPDHANIIDDAFKKLQENPRNAAAISTEALSKLNIE